MKRGELIVSLEVGTTKTCVVVGEISPPSDSNGGFLPDSCQAGSAVQKDAVNIIGFGITESKGIRKGVIVNMEDAVDSVKKAIREAEAMSGVSIKAVYIGTKGRHIDYINSQGVIAVRGGEIKQEDVDGAIESAKAVAIPFDREILHVIPTGFTVDGQNGIYDPRGMEGVRLETNVRIITADAMTVHNLTKVCQRAGVDVIDVVFEPFATAMAVLHQGETEMGVALVDIGGGTTDIALFHEGSICHASVLPVGGMNFTNDIAIGLRISVRDAENMKKRHGSSMLSLVVGDEEIEVAYSEKRQTRMLPKRHLIEIIQPRAEELLSLVAEDIRKSGLYGILASGIVLTGGGSLLDGMDIMAENIIELPVRRCWSGVLHGLPDDLNSPAFTSSIGLVIHGAGEVIRMARHNDGDPFRGVVARLKEWTRGIFKF